MSDTATKDTNPKDSTIGMPRRKWWHLPLTAAMLFWLVGGAEVFLLRDLGLLALLAGILAVLHMPIGRWLKKPESRWIEPTWFVIVFTGTCLLLLFVIPPFSILRQTTYLTQPRLTDSYGIDYFAVLESRIEPTAPAEDNGLRLLIEKLGRPFIVKNTIQYKNDLQWDRLCEKLHVDREIDPSVSFVDFERFIATLTENERKTITRIPIGSIPPTFVEEELPVVKRWLDENAPALDIFVEALQKPVFYAPPTIGEYFFHSVPLAEHLSPEISRNLQVRFRYRLAVNDFDGAKEDVLSLYRIAELQRRSIWNIHCLIVNQSLLVRANHSAESLLCHTPWSDDEIRKLAEEIKLFQSPFTEEEIKSALLGERFAALDNLQVFSSGRLSFDKIILTTPPTKSSEIVRLFERCALRMSRWNIAMRDVNVFFDEIDRQGIKAMARKSEADRLNFRFWKVMLWYGPMQTAPHLLRRVMDVHLLEPLWTNIQGRRIDSDLMQIHFALERYRSNHADYPESLEELRGIFLEEVPFDPHSEKPYRYRRERTPDDNPGCVVYSIGTNEIDEKGRTWRDTPKGDDMRRRLPEDDILSNQK